MDTKQLNEKVTFLCDLLVEKGLTRVSITEGKTSVVIEKGHISNTKDQKSTMILNNTEISQTQTLNIDDKSNLKKIKACAVGTVYLCASPCDMPFVEVGTTIKKGQKLCVLESMKMFSDIVSDTDGVIKEICVKNGEVVGIGDTIFTINTGEVL